MNRTWLGCRRDARDARDHMFRVATRFKLPQSVDLREHCPSVMDQGNLGSCVWHGTTGALRHILIAAGRPDIKFSRLQGYYDTREIEGTIASDAGCEIRDAIKVLAKIGVGHESLWPYKIANFAKKPPAKVYQDALRFKALTYQRVPVSTIGLKQALAKGFPVIIGVALYDSFEGIGPSGVMPMPDLEREPMIGGHCMYAVGYRKGYFIVRNSWSGRFGDHGDIYMPEAYAGSPKFGADYWIIKTEGVE